MKQIEILNSRDRKKLLKTLKQLFGVKSLPEELVYFTRRRREEVYVVRKEVFILEPEQRRSIHMGLHFGTKTEKGFILTMDGAQLLKEQISKQIYEVTDEQRDEWLQGKNLNARCDGKQVIIRKGQDTLGAGICKKEIIVNTLAKNRRLKNIIPEATVKCAL